MSGRITVSDGLITCFLYDLDDTLVKTTANWLQAATEYLKQRALPYQADSVYRFLGKNCRDLCMDIATAYPQSLAAGIEACAEEFRNDLRHQAEVSPPEEIEGASRFLRLMASTIGQYVASGSPADLIEAHLNRLGWKAIIQASISSETVAHGKPDPAVYNQLISMIGVAPGQCVIFEDSPAGIEAAERASIRCVVINPKVPTSVGGHIIAVSENYSSLLSNPDWISFSQEQSFPTTAR